MQLNINKLSKDYIRPIFNDVITIVDTCDCINQESVVWFHNGEEVGSGPYYQQEGGLDGIYFAEFSFSISVSTYSALGLYVGSWCVSRRCSSVRSGIDSPGR